jgi:hypothetical protein
MTLWGVVVLVLSAILWFLSGSSSNGQPTLGPIYGGTWQIIFMLTGVVGLVLIIVGFVKKKPSTPSAPSTPPENPPAENK